MVVMVMPQSDHDPRSERYLTVRDDRPVRAATEDGVPLDIVA
jgi:hypothetical protein